MTCSYCGTRSSEGEHRCRRCGRKPGDTLSGEYTLVQTTGALATQPAFRAQEQAAAASAPRLRSGPDFAHAVQRSLFQERQESNVIPIESYAPAPPRPAVKPVQRTQKPAPRRRSRVSEQQESLDFLPAAPAKPRTLSTTVEALIYCEDRVATKIHRTLAAALDWTMVILAYGLFLTVYWLMGGGFVLDSRVDIAMFAAPLVIFGAMYGLLWCLACTETPGMRWTGLRLTTFEGFHPDRRERLWRFLGSCLSMCTVIGLAWCIADEENLAWQDHISRTFPTPRRDDIEVFHRR
jgi:uncharacterized RDD family membrane protein YckC